MASNASADVRPSIWTAAGKNDVWLEAFVIFNFVSLAGDVLIAHYANRFRVAVEYAPIWFSLLAAVLLLLVFRRHLNSSFYGWWRVVGQVVGWASIAVGTAGVIYHLDSQFFYERTLKSLTYAAPFAAPLSFVGLGCLLIMNRMVKPTGLEWPQWVMFFALGGFAGNFVLSLTDHAINGFFNWAEWIPVVSSALAVGFLTVLLWSRVTMKFLSYCSAILLLQIAVGGLGFLLHAWADLHGHADTLLQNFIGGAPPFAPLLLPNLAILGFLGIVAMRRSLPT